MCGITNNINIDNIANKELIEKYRSLNYENTRLFKEIFARYTRRDMTNSEYNEVQNIQARDLASIFDEFVPTASDEVIKNEIFKAMKVVLDKNR